jgi:hypothetical protein
MMASKDNASGMPLDMPLLPDLTESWIDLRLVSIEVVVAVSG